MLKNVEEINNIDKDEKQHLSEIDEQFKEEILKLLEEKIMNGGIIARLVAIKLLGNEYKSEEDYGKVLATVLDNELDKLVTDDSSNKMAQYIHSKVLSLVEEIKEVDLSKFTSGYLNTLTMSKRSYPRE